MWVDLNISLDAIHENLSQRFFISSYIFSRFCPLFPTFRENDVFFHVPGRVPRLCRLYLCSSRASCGRLTACPIFEAPSSSVTAAHCLKHRKSQPNQCARVPLRAATVAGYRRGRGNWALSRRASSSYPTSTSTWRPCSPAWRFNDLIQVADRQKLLPATNYSVVVDYVCARRGRRGAPARLLRARGRPPTTGEGSGRLWTPGTASTRTSACVSGGSRENMVVWVYQLVPLLLSCALFEVRSE